MPPSSRLPVLRRSIVLLGWIMLALLPVIYIASQVIGASRNIVFWDEVDTALDLILRIHDGAEWPELLRRFFAINNEHRTVTSRLLFAASYWLTGTVNFHVIGAIGNLFLVGASAVLIAAVTGWERRVRLGVILAFLMFQMEHFESFIWSGASIDHFQVVMLGVATIAALARGTRRGMIAAVAFGLLATFTLAHGNLVWPVGAALLLQQRRWGPLAAWCGFGALAVVSFLHGFQFNPSHHVSDITLDRVGRIAHYWVALLGAPLTLGDAGFARLPGIVLLVGLAIVVAHGAVRREPVALFSALFAVGALGMVAYGRAEISGAEINSRYLVLGALAWALLIYMLLELATPPEKPFRWLVRLVPAMAAFNISANLRYAPLAESFIEVRDRAATRFMHYGEDGRGIVRLHPKPGHADILLKMAADRGVYCLPRVSHAAEFPDAQPSTRIITHVDELLVNDRAITAGGWAMIRGKVSQRGQVYLVLRSAQSSLIFSAATLQRGDVASAYQEPGWRLSGFRAVIGRKRLPAEDFDVGVLIADGDRSEFVMTPNRVLLAAGAAATAVRPASAQ